MFTPSTTCRPTTFLATQPCSDVCTPLVASIPKRTLFYDCPRGGCPRSYHTCPRASIIYIGGTRQGKFASAVLKCPSYCSTSRSHFITRVWGFVAAMSKTNLHVHNLRWLHQFTNRSTLYIFLHDLLRSSSFAVRVYAVHCRMSTNATNVTTNRSYKNKSSQIKFEVIAIRGRYMVYLSMVHVKNTSSREDVCATVPRPQCA